MVPEYTTKGNDAAVYSMGDGTLLVIQRKDAGEDYGVLRANSIIKAIEMADAWQEWRDAIKRQTVDPYNEVPA